MVEVKEIHIAKEVLNQYYEIGMAGDNEVCVVHFDYLKDIPGKHLLYLHCFSDLPPIDLKEDKSWTITTEYTGKALRKIYNAQIETIRPNGSHHRGFPFYFVVEPSIG